MVYIILGQGFEEAEALVPCDILRRGGVEVALAGIGGRRITGGHGITVEADCLIGEADAAAAEMIVVPGGMGGVESILASPVALEKIKTTYEGGGFVAAVCAGPLVLAELGLLKGRRAVCYPGLEEKLTGARTTQRRSVVKDGDVITGRGPGAAFDFGFGLLKALKGRNASRRVREEMHYRTRRVAR